MLAAASLPHVIPGRGPLSRLCESAGSKGSGSAGKPTNKHQKRSAAWRRLLEERGIVDDAAALPDDIQLQRVLSNVAEHQHNTFRLRRSVSVWRRWAQGTYSVPW